MEEFLSITHLRHTQLKKDQFARFCKNVIGKKLNTIPTEYAIFQWILFRKYKENYYPSDILKYKNAK